MQKSTTGYSGTPLLQKLGIKPAMKVLLLNAPEAYTAWLGTDITLQLAKKGQVPDFIHLFAKDEASFIKGMATVLIHCQKNTQAIVWVSWYKKSAGISTDLNENVIRAFALANKLVDIKVCAVSDQWSGLKLVVPVALR